MFFGAVISEPDQLFVHHRLHLLHQFQGFLLTHIRRSQDFSPCLVINLGKVARKSWQLIFADMFKRIVRVIHNAFGPLHDGWVHTRHQPIFLDRGRNRVLLKIIAKAVILKKQDVIGLRVGHSVVWFMLETLHQQAPPTVAVAKVNRAVHRFHSPIRKPGFAGIKKRVGRFLVINALKKTHTARRLLIASYHGFLVHKSRHPPNGLIFIIQQQPSNTFAGFEQFVFFRIEDALQVGI